MKLIPLEIGRLESDLRTMGGAEGRAVLPIPSWLIEHPNGVALASWCIGVHDVFGDGRMLENMAVPSFGFDTELQKDSMRELQRLRDKENCRLLYGHDLDQFRSLPADGLR